VPDSVAGSGAERAPAQINLDDAAVLLSKLGHRSKRMFTQRLEPLALKPNHVQVLVFLGGHPGASQRSLVEALRVTPSTIVDLIDELESRRLVERLRNPLNRRASLVSLTEDGEAILDQALDLSRAVEDDLLAPLAARDRRRLLGYLHAIDAANRRSPPRVAVPAGSDGAEPELRRAAGRDAWPGVAAHLTGAPAAEERIAPGDRLIGRAPAMAEDGPSSSSKADRAYETLRQWITEGVYQPGDRLVLQQIARDLKISTVPVREAIRRLEAEGFADFQRNVGARVSSVDTALYAEAMRTLAVLEGAATAMAAERLTRRDLDAAERLNERMAAGLSRLDPAGFTQANRDFHDLLCRPCANTHLLALINVEWSRLAAIRTSTFAFVPERAANAVQEHRHLLARLRAKAPNSEIETLMRDHRMATVHAFLERQDELSRPPA
jgi:DNA-binding GntR family transcriptional regulator/DNA-binding MarR family transcriptional regulator